MDLIPSFTPFKIENTPTNESFLFTLTIDEELSPIEKTKLKLIRKFDTGNGDTAVFHIDNGGYQYIIANINKVQCCLLQTNKDFSNCHCALNGSYMNWCFGLNNALMLIFAFASCKYQTLLIHASVVGKDNYAYAFIAKSGTGKSTQSSMWLQSISGCELINDDNPIVRIIDNTPYIYGSPWSGKTACYRNIRMKLGAIVRIDRASENSIDKLKPTEAFASILPSCSAMKWDHTLFTDLCKTLSLLIEARVSYILHCLPNKESALLCYKTVKSQTE
ncbi:MULTISPECIES: hypothetical protein [unclassified Prevotella]|uniref:hypothetical protein n=1 Tax=unclassified Prevotella TaxID=2638335 RepID=UPI000AB8FAED|nr:MULTISPECIES: hypothetical protein [unclassified Prevotella]